jgi:5-formyltetrahydrofolate cyclo-ligase
MTNPRTAGEAEGPPPPLDKQALRRHFRILRAAALAAAEPRILAAAGRDLPHLLPTGQHLGLYWPLPGEPDLRPLAPAHQHLALPTVAGEPPQLLYRPWRPGAPLAPDRYGIPAPLTLEPELPPNALALLLVPALAFDPHSGIRLGYGGGWYDRLRSDPAWAAVPALVVLPSACLSGNLPREPWDVPFRGWLDEHGVHSTDARAADDPEAGEAVASPL